MSTWQTIWQLLRYRGWFLSLLLLGSLALYGLTVVPGVLAREIFNRLTDPAPVRFGLWTLVTLIVLSTVARQIIYWLFSLGSALHRHLLASLLRSNLLEQLFQRPGAQALPYSAGETLSRFRDDVNGALGFIGSGFHLVSSAFQATIAAVILLRIDPLLTLIVFAPLLLVTVLINQEDALVVDLRAAGDFQAGHIAGSKNVQMAQFDPENKQLAPARALPIVLVCQNGITVNGAAKRLRKAGFERVHILEGGITAWREAGLPLVKGKG